MLSRDEQSAQVATGGVDPAPRFNILERSVDQKWGARTLTARYILQRLRFYNSFNAFEGKLTKALANRMLPEIPQKRQLLWIGFLILLGYGAELGQFTYAYDYYHNQIAYANSPATVYSDDGRYLAELLKKLTFDSAAPTLYLAIALVALAVASLYLIGIFPRASNGSSQNSLLLATPVVVLYPFLFDVFAFVSVRISVGFGFLFAAAGAYIVLRKPDIIGYVLAILLLNSSLMLYQSTFNVALIMIFFSAIGALVQNNDLKTTVKTKLGPGITVAITSIGAYILIQNVWASQHLRFDSFYRYPQDLTEVEVILNAYGNATFELLFSNQSLFPLIAKTVVLAVLITIFYELIKALFRGSLSLRNALVLVLLLILAFVASYGICLPFYPPARYIQYRIYTPFAFFTGACLALALQLGVSGIGRIVARSCSVLLIYIFIVNLNIAHQYLWLKNDVDKATALVIASRLKSEPMYKPGLPLVIVGHLPQDVAFPIAKSFTTIRQTQFWEFTAVNSTFATGWSTERGLMPYLTFANPTETAREIASQYASDADCWPGPGSVAIIEGIMVVVLNKTGKEGHACQPQQP